MFPVKLRTYIGKPIEYDENRTPDELAELVFYFILKKKIFNMIFLKIYFKRLKKQLKN